jgi:hypothetical protein
MKRHFLIIALLSLFVFQMNVVLAGAPKVVKKQIVQALEKAARTGTNTIIIITDTKGEGLEDALTLASQTVSAGSDALIAIVDREANDNSELSLKYQMARYPLPYLLILSPSGFITGGAASGKISAEKFAEYLPTPAFNQVLAARAANSTSLVLVSSAGAPDAAECLKTIEQAKATITPMPAIVEVNAADAAERNFLRKLSYDENQKSSQIIVVNAAGQVVGTFDAGAAPSAIAAAASKTAAKGCGGCSSAKSCAGKKDEGCGK